MDQRFLRERAEYGSRDLASLTLPAQAAYKAVRLRKAQRLVRRAKPGEVTHSVTCEPVSAFTDELIACSAGAAAGFFS